MKIQILSMSLCIILLALAPRVTAAPKLYDFRSSTYSQWGEDGIIAKIFEIIGTTDKVCVEFGAADGFWFSNTAALWTNDSSWKAYLIESDPTAFARLRSNIAKYDNVYPIQARIGLENETLLENILSGEMRTIDLLSIDIDGNDYYILQSLGRLRPRLIICEYNPSIPIYMDIYGAYGPNNTIQSSALSLKRVAQDLGYSLVALTITNAFFVRNEDFVKFAGFETDIEKIDVNRDYCRFVVHTAFGKYIEMQAKKFEPSPTGHLYDVTSGRYDAPINGKFFQ